MKVLYLIPARGGSKRIPNKNINLLGGVPLIHHTINAVRKVVSDEHICVSTDSDAILDAVRSTGLDIPFKRPAHLASDTTGSQDVILHALQYYALEGLHYDAVMLLQPTSPFRKAENIRGVLSEFSRDKSLEMVVSVGEAYHNPYFSLFEENADGYLSKSKESEYIRSQDIPKVYYYNGSMYLIKASAIQTTPISKLKYVKKYVMDEISSMDIDTPLDWLICETIIKTGHFSI